MVCCQFDDLTPFGFGCNHYKTNNLQDCRMYRNKPLLNFHSLGFCRHFSVSYGKMVCLEEPSIALKSKFCTSYKTYQRVLSLLLLHNVSKTCARLGLVCSIVLVKTQLLNIFNDPAGNEVHVHGLSDTYPVFPLPHSMFELCSMCMFCGMHE